MEAPVNIVPNAPYEPSTREPLRRLRVLVGIHDGVLSGVNTYVEQVAAAAATAVEEVTLLVAHDSVAAEARARLEGAGVEVISLGLAPITPGQRHLDRLAPGHAARRLSAALRTARPRLPGGFDAVHLNHPHLASTARPLGGRVCVAAWFYPHTLAGRLRGTWEHSGRRFPRSALLALKGVSHYRNDVRGFRAADVAVAPTHALAAQLRSAGIEAVQCTPPARALGDGDGEETDGCAAPRLLVCSGDLSHPRKNVSLAVAAVGELARDGRHLRLELVGGNPEALAEALRRLPRSIEVLLSGRLPAAEVQRRMRRADLLLFPSLFEEWGYVAAEAALQGTPVVTLPVYPFSEMLEEPYGFRAARVSASGYAEAIAAALESRAGRSDVADAARRRFGLDGAGRRLAAIWAGELSSDAAGDPLR
jgi:glycosyltransferase involved in cell wall biosynthesis